MFKGSVVLARYEFFPFIYALLLTVKNVGIPTVFILKTLQMKNGIVENKGFTRIMASVAFFLVQFTFILSADMDIINSLINPLVLKTADNIDYHIYKLGFMQMNYGVSQSIWLLKLIAQLIIGFIAYFVLYSISKSSFSNNFDFENISQVSQNVNPAGLIAPALYSLFIIWFVFKPLVIDGLKGIFGSAVLFQSHILSSFILYIIVYRLIALASVPISVLMSKSILTEGGFGKFARFIFIFLFIAGGMGIHQYIFIRNIGLINTLLCFIPYYIIPVTNSLVLAIILYHRKFDSETEELSFAWKAAFSLGIIQFVKMWNSEYIPLVFMLRQDRMPPVLLSKVLAQGLNAGGIDLPALLGMDLLVSVLPVVLFLIFRRFITEWILLAYTKIRY